MTLLILAAGMGSRFGGLKQMEPIGPNGEFIIDYSIYDAIKAGFSKVVFVIKKEIYEDFKATIGKRVEDHIDVEYVFQDINDIPINMVFNRNKPWGTGHAILSAKDVIKENFAIINADDFYGRDAFLKAYEFLKSSKDNEFGLVGYKAKNTLTENGSVKRGILNIEDGKLVSITESSIEKIGDYIKCVSLSTNEEFNVALDTLVSMNMLLFSPKIFQFLENDFIDFLNGIKDIEKEEFLIPEVVSNHIASGDITVRVLETSSNWCGVTYKEDKENVQNTINNYINNGEYKYNLWN